MDIYERLRASEQSRRLAWQILQEIRQVLEILGDQRIPYEGERKWFRAEGDFLIRALVDLISQFRSQIHQFERDFEELRETRRRTRAASRCPPGDASRFPPAKDPRS